MAHAEPVAIHAEEFCLYVDAFLTGQAETARL